MNPLEPNVSEYLGFNITVTDWGATFEYHDNPVRCGSLASAMQIINVLVDYDARHAKAPLDLVAPA